MSLELRIDAAHVLMMCPWRPQGAPNMSIHIKSSFPADSKYISPTTLYFVPESPLHNRARDTQEYTLSYELCLAKLQDHDDIDHGDRGRG